MLFHRKQCVAFHFSVVMKRMHQASRHSPDVPESLLVPHGSPVVSRRMAVMKPSGVYSSVVKVTASDGDM